MILTLNKVVLNILMSFILLNYYCTELLLIYGNIRILLQLNFKRNILKQNSIKILLNVISVFPIFTPVKLPDFAIIPTIQNILGSIKIMAWLLIIQWTEHFQKYICGQEVKCELEIWPSNFHTFYPTNFSIKESWFHQCKNSGHFAWGFFVTLFFQGHS